MNRRVDKCVHTLLTITRDKSFQRLIKVVSRSQTHPTASDGKGLGTCYTTTCSSVLRSF